jgi:hypothetical protein
VPATAVKRAYSVGNATFELPRQALAAAAEIQDAESLTSRNKSLAACRADPQAGNRYSLLSSVLERGTDMKFLFSKDNVVRLSSRIKTADSDASRALEQAWLKRRQELAGWQPSNGWLLDQKVIARRSH